MFNIGPFEAVIILVAALILLGPERLPELARGLGKFLREFRRQTDDVRNMVEREFYKMDEQLKLDEALKNPPQKDPNNPLPANLKFDAFGHLIPQAKEGDDSEPTIPEGAHVGFPVPSPTDAIAPTTTAPIQELAPHHDPPLPMLRPPEGTVSRAGTRILPAEAPTAPNPLPNVKPGES